MKRVSVVFALVALACSASSEPRSRESVSSPPQPSPIATDAQVAVPTAVDATEIVTVDAPVAAPDRPMTPRTLYPVLELVPIESGTRVTIGIGQRQGVNSTWKARLVDKEGRDIRRGELTISVVGQAQTKATTTLPSEAIPMGVQAHLRSY